jgi:flagellum-specific ATP synthase
MSAQAFHIYRDRLNRLNGAGPVGRVQKVVGLTVESQGPPAALGEACTIATRGGRETLAEVVGFRDGRVLLMPWEQLDGISPGAFVRSTGRPMQVPVGAAVLGRIIDPLGRPIDDHGPLTLNHEQAGLVRDVPNPSKRARIDTTLATGVRVLDAFTTCGRGQRIGIFAGSGVGKSSLLGMISRHSSAEINVIALIGERGREVLEFVEKDLGPEALKRSVIIVATSDQPALVRVKAAFTANTIAAWFRNQGKHVLLMMDSLTRLAMAQREVGLAIGEPPAQRGYPPSVFGLMPVVLEQAGCNERGAITGFYTILTEGDDWNDPISDCARSILDGHILLSRKLASENQYPAVEVLESLSRLQSTLVNDEQKKIVAAARHVLAVHRQYKELLDIGAYKSGTNPQLDTALQIHPHLMEFLRQPIAEKTGLVQTFEQLKTLLMNGTKRNHA